MDDNMPTIKDVDISFPITFLREALNRCCVEGQNFHWEGKQRLNDSHERHEVRDCHINTCKYDNFLTIKIEKARFTTASSVLLILDYIEEVTNELHAESTCLPVEVAATLHLVPRTELQSNNLQTKSQDEPTLELDPLENLATVPVMSPTAKAKHKGRPKRKTPPVSYKNPKSARRKASQKESHLSEENIVTSPENSDGSKKHYSLRGRKIDPKIIRAEKGIYEQDRQKTSGVDKNRFTHKNTTSDSINRNEIIQPSMINIDEDSTSTAEVPNEVNELDESDDNVVQENEENNVPAKKVYNKREEIPKDKLCKYCDYASYDYSYLMNHVRKHEQTDEVIEYINELEQLKVANCTCPTCATQFPNERKRRNHEKSEHKFAMCNLCFQMFKNDRSLKVHIRNIHERTEGQKLICETCSATFKSITSLKQHQDSVHLEKRNHPCVLCDKKFSTGSQLRRHIRIHGLDESKRVKCDLCSKSFLHRHNLQRHMQIVHSSDNKLEKYHCSYCGKGYTQKMNMIAHVQYAHFNIFPYTCKLCKMTFYKSHFLLEHMMSVHKQTGVKISESCRNQIYGKDEDDRFNCAYCSQEFIHKIRLIEHMHFDHSDAFPFRCEHCHQGFLNKTFLTLHSLKAHRIKIPEEGEELSTNCMGTGDILRIISVKKGKLSTLDKAQDTDVDQADYAMTDHIAESDVNDGVTDGIQSGSTVLVEVAEDNSSSYQYVIESQGHLQDTDIAQLLLAAQQSIHTQQATKLPDQIVETGEAVVDIQQPTSETQVLPSLQETQIMINNSLPENNMHYHILEAGKEMNNIQQAHDVTNIQTHDIITNVETVDIQNSDMIQTSDVQESNIIQASDLQNSDIIQTSDIQNSNVIQASEIGTSDNGNMETAEIQNIQTSNLQTLEILASDVEKVPSVEIPNVYTLELPTSDIRTSNICTLELQTSELEASELQTSNIQNSDIQTSEIHTVAAQEEVQYHEN